jgi:hypothetical protein
MVNNSSVDYLLFSIIVFPRHLFVSRMLNGNSLEGRVPEELYSIGVHGGAIEYASFLTFTILLVYYIINFLVVKSLAGPSCNCIWTYVQYP